MRGAPPVQMACGRDARTAAAVGLLAAGAAASGVGWLGWHADAQWGWVLMSTALAALIGAAIGWWQIERLGDRRLAWDGRTWTLDGTPGEVAVMIDTGNWMQLRFRSAGGVAWLPLALRRCGAPTHLARAALHAHAGRTSAAGAAGFDANG